MNFQVRQDIELRGITDESLFGFEFFVFRSPPMMAEMDAFIREAKGKACFMDVGANAGLFSCVFQRLNPTGESRAFEPSKDWLPHLTENAKGKGVLVYDYGLSDHDGELTGHTEDRMFIPGESELLGIDPCTHNNLFEILVSTGDNFCKLFGVTPDLIKVDVEGHEAKVLRGLLTTITNHKPTIMLETHHPYLERNGLQEELTQVLSELPEHETETVGPNHSILKFK